MKYADKIFRWEHSVKFVDGTTVEFSGWLEDIWEIRWRLQDREIAVSNSTLYLMKEPRRYKVAPFELPPLLKDREAEIVEWYIVVWRTCTGRNSWKNIL